MKRFDFLLTMLGIVFVAFSQTGRAQNPSPPAGSQAPGAGAAASPVAAARPADRAMVVPADTVIPLRIVNTISTRTAYEGQTVFCRTTFPISVDNHIVIPVGSGVKGSITQVVRPGRIKGKGQMRLRFDTLVLPNGETLQLRGELSGFGGNGREGFKRQESQIEGESGKGRDAGKVVRTTVAGAEIGTIAGAGTHHVGEGRAIGSGAGAAGGLIWALASRGREIVLPAGSTFELQLVTPLTLQR